MDDRKAMALLSLLMILSGEMAPINFDLDVTEQSRLKNDGWVASRELMAIIGVGPDLAPTTGENFIAYGLRLLKHLKELPDA